MSAVAAASRPRAAIFILTQNNDVRKTHLKNCLYFLFRNFNATFRYPVIIFHEGDFDTKAQREIITGVRATCRSLVSFQQLDPSDFVVPDHVDADKMRRCIDLKVVPYWRTDKYRLMCRWWSINCWKYAKAYDYIMRLDDDSIIEEPITTDLFAWAAQNNIVYSSNIMSMDCGLCNHGFKELLEKMFPNEKHLKIISQLFVAQDMPMRSVQLHPFRSLLSITDPDIQIEETMRTWGMLYYFNNYFITRVAFWERPDVRAALDEIDRSGLMYYKRLGDAPIHTAIVSLFAEPSQIKRTVFKYSKRLQREAFIGDDGECHAYFPDTYEKSGCITQKN